ncbi:hypothetical protein KKE74_01175 [Patescibacteria group bacterium]|nr:hypothetical protein [Patescibacteria group bacterium]
MLLLQKKLFGSLGISLLILILFIYLIAFPLIDKIKANSQEYLDNQSILTVLHQKETLFKELEKTYQEREDDLLMIEDAFLKTKEAVGFISTLENIAKETGNVFEIKTVNSFTPLPDEEGDSFLVLRISLWGGFSNLLSFIASLEDSPYPPYRLIGVDSLNIKRLGKIDLANLSYNLKIGDLETIVGIKVYTQ